MLFELRTYDLAAGQTPAYLEQFRTLGLGLITRHLPLGGYWMTESGALNRIHHLWVYRDLAERSECRLAVAADKEWNGAFVPKAFSLVVAQRNSFLVLELSSSLLDGVVVRRRDHHPAHGAGQPMFAPNWFRLGMMENTYSSSKEDKAHVATFRVVSGYRPGAKIILHASADGDGLLGANGATEHELMRPLLFSPLR